MRPTRIAEATNDASDNIAAHDSPWGHDGTETIRVCAPAEQQA